ncbi:MAG TPA: Xaa-Pro peptidase family protein [Desulfobacteraceae bacterium]|nr:Xaa-Pro peptidase family protein [Desulfobacteraceae bacterium]
MESYSQGAPGTEIDARIARLQSAMEAKGVKGALVVQKSDLFYFSGTVQQGWLYVPCQGKPLLMVFKEYDRARAETPLSSVVSLVSPKKIPHTLAEHGYSLPGTVGMELDVLPVNLYFLYQRIFENAEIVDISTEIRMIRAVKSDYELELIRAAAAMSDRLAARAAELIEPGKSEIALAGELEACARSLGHQGIVRMRLWGSEIFYGHIMSGPEAAVPSYMASPTGGTGPSPATGQGAGFNTIEKNQPVLVDYVFALNGYLSDHARIFSIGRLDDDLLRAHEAMLEVQNMAKIEGCAGIPAGELYRKMVDMATEKGYDQYFMGVGDRRIRFTGHGVGLELDEFPFIAQGQKLVLEKGMVLALEPKVIMPGRGVVGIENTHVVTEKGLEPLTQFSGAVFQV